MISGRVSGLACRSLLPRRSVGILEISHKRQPVSVSPMLTPTSSIPACQGGCGRPRPVPPAMPWWPGGEAAGMRFPYRTSTKFLRWCDQLRPPPRTLCCRPKVHKQAGVRILSSKIFQKVPRHKASLRRGRLYNSIPDVAAPRTASPLTLFPRACSSSKIFLSTSAKRCASNDPTRRSSTTDAFCRCQYMLTLFGDVGI